METYIITIAVLFGMRILTNLIVLATLDYDVPVEMHKSVQVIRIIISLGFLIWGILLIK